MRGPAMRGRPPPMAQITKVAPLVCNNNVVTLMTYDTENFDTDGMYDPASPNRLTIRTAGIYRLSHLADCAPNGAAVRIAYVRLNGAGPPNWYDSRPAVNLAGVDTQHGFAIERKMVVGDYIEAQYFQNSGANLAVASFLSAVFLGKAG